MDFHLLSFSIDCWWRDLSIVQINDRCLFSVAYYCDRKAFDLDILFIHILNEFRTSI